ncbi:hypothetical protein DL93DRAFT_2169322 [Clavulina sp. PMI_390]|nr:hypothetical protein DL93DRAFT_2169322 [Clavulina sp. PMI_390]
MSSSSRRIHPPPPHYILLSQSSLPSASIPAPNSLQLSTSSSSTLVFPEIHYHYADDPPLTLLPSSSSSQDATRSAISPQYLVMDWDPNAPNGEAVVRSISDDVQVVGVKVSPAPGVLPAAEGELESNTNMYIIDCIGGSQEAGLVIPAMRQALPDASNTPQNPAIALARFKQRNALLRETFEYNLQKSLGIESSVEPALDEGGDKSEPHPGSNEALAPPLVSKSPASSPETMKNVPLSSQ